MKKAKLGQHFLTRPEIAQKIANTLDVSKEDTVLEIGPGHGILTKELLKNTNNVIAVEKDENLINELKTTFSNEISSKKLTLLNNDIRDFNVEKYIEGKYVVIANIPYYITGYIIKKFLTDTNQPKEMSLLIQKEVAERIVAKKNKHSILSLSVHVYGTPKLEKTIKPGAFSPPPKVNSAILSIKNISRNNFKSKKHEEFFFKIIKQAFSQKRKTLGSTLKNVLDNNFFEKCNVDKKIRPEDVSLEKWLCLSNLKLLTPSTGRPATTTGTSS